MSHDIREMFESRHVFKYLGINKDQLHHWVKTKRLIKPAVEGKGRGGRNKFSFENLLDLALIKELTTYGVELNIINDILTGITDYFAEDIPDFHPKKTIWQIFKKRRRHYVENECVLLIERGIEKAWVFGLLEGDVALDQIREDITYLEFEGVPALRSVLLINIYGIVGLLEKDTGMRL